MSQVCISVNNLEKQYGETKAVNQVSFEVEKGTVFGMLGPNGAGKSSTIETLVGVKSRDGGNVKILDLDPETDREKLKEKVGVQLQSPALFGRLTVGELVSLFASFYKEPFNCKQVIEMVGLEDKKNTYTDSLSGGQKHRLAIALAVVGNGDIIFLDEPTTGLDPQSRRQLWYVIEELKSMGKTIFMTTHYMDEAEKLCDQLVIIDKGKVITSGSPRDLIDEYFEEDAVEFRNPYFTEEELGSLASLSSVTRQSLDVEEIIVLYTKDASKTISDLIGYAQKLGKDIDGLSLRKPTLEDLFLKLTGRKIR